MTKVQSIMNTIELEITDATQYATAYINGKPVATVARKRVYDKGPNFSVYNMSGRCVGRCYASVSLKRIIATYLSRQPD